MRTLSNAYTNLYSHTAGWRTFIRVQISNDIGVSWQLLNDFHGRDFVLAAAWGETVDESLSEVTFTLVREIDGWSLSPYMESSGLNQTSGSYSAALRIGRTLFRLLTVSVPLDQEAPTDLTEYEMQFFGVLRSVAVAGEGTLEVIVRDLAQLALDRFTEPVAGAEPVYGSTSGEPLEDVLQDLLTDNVLSGSITLSVPSSPGWDLGPFAQKAMPTLEAMRQLALQIGWDLRMRWESGSGYGAFNLVLREPDRANTTPDFTVVAGQVLGFVRFDVNVEDIRNVVDVVYSDKADLDAGGVPKRKTYTATDSASVTKYTRRWMRITEAATSNIDTATEAQALADAALSDLAEPLAEAEVELLYHHHFQLGDLIRLEADGVHFDSDQDLAIVALRHAAGGGEGRTRLTLRGKPMASRMEWLARDARPAGSPTPRFSGPSAPTSLSSETTAGGFRLRWNPPTNLPKPEEYELHVSTSSSFTPSSSTRRVVGKLTEMVVTDLDPGTTYYAKVVPRDLTGNRGTASSEVTLVPRYVEPRRLQPRVTYAALPLNSDFEAYNSTTSPPDTWSLLVGQTWGTDALEETSIRYSGSRAVRLAATGTNTRLVSEFIQVRPNDIVTPSAVFYGGITSYTSGNDASLVIIWYDADFASISSTTVHTLAGDSATWQELGGGRQAVAPSTARYMRLSVGKSAGNAYVILVDSARLFINPRANYDIIPSLNTGWVDASSGSGTLSYYRDSTGRVHLTGAVASGTVNTVAFTLDTGYLPEQTVEFVTYGDGTTHGSVTIDIAGDVLIKNGPNVLSIITHVSLDGISFRASV